MRYKRSLKYFLIFSLLFLCYLFPPYHFFSNQSSFDSPEAAEISVNIENVEDYDSVIFPIDSITLKVKEYQKRYQYANFSPSAPSLVYDVNGFPGGFASLMNCMLNAYVLANRANIPFHILIDNWHYGTFFNLIEDFSETLTSPILMQTTNILLKQKYPQLPWQRNQNSLTNFSQLLQPYDHFFFSQWGTNFRFLLNFNFGVKDSELFPEKQILAQSLWSLRPEMKRQISALKRVMFDKETPFIAVHIRRGDKVNTEMADIPISNFTDKILELAHAEHKLYSTNSQAVNVFVFSDDDAATAKFAHVLKNARQGENVLWNVRTWIEGMRILNEKLILENRTGHLYLPIGFSFKNVLKWHRLTGFNRNSASTVSKIERDYLTHELVSTISFAALSNHLICTFTSNICRLIALLRGENSLKTTISLDREFWFPH